MHQALHAGFLHGVGDLAGQIHMHVFKAVLVAMQYGHQVHQRIMAGHQSGQIGFAVHRGLDHGQAGQALHAGRIHGAARGHGDVPAQAGQLLANVTADKAAAPQDQNALGVHAALKPPTAWCMASMA